jgi:hypothetical protein
VGGCGGQCRVTDHAGGAITSIPQGGLYVAGLSQIPGTRDVLAATASTYDTAMTILKYIPLRARLQ